MPKPKPIFDKQKAIETVAKGRRSRWIVRRGGKSKGFYYEDASGKRVTDEATLERIKALVIPPAWTHVRINPSAGGRLQCVGIDTTGRVQYRYHATFSQKQQRKKFAKIEKFGDVLPQFKAITTEHLCLEGLPREKVLACVMRLINSLYFRVGTEKSETHYKTYGVTTLLKKHLVIGRKGKLEFNFVGKSHVEHRKVLVDEELASVIKEISSLKSGRRLFRYLDETTGKPRPVTPSQVNSYLKSATAPEYSAKDLRTWAGTLLTAIYLAEMGPAETDAETKKNIVAAVRRVAHDLGNTPAVCRSSYIHPAVISAYEKGLTIAEFRPRNSRSIRRAQADLDPEERALIQLLRGSSNGSSR